MSILDSVESGYNLMARLYKGTATILTLLFKGVFAILAFLIVLWALLLVLEAGYIILVLLFSHMHSPHITP